MDKMTSTPEPRISSRKTGLKAVAFAQQATSVNPQNAEAWLVVGAVDQQREHYNEARSAYEKYLKLAPKGRYAGEIRTILTSMPQ